MKLDELQATNRKRLNQPGPRMWLALQAVRGGKPLSERRLKTPQNREQRRAAERGVSEYSALGQVYANTTPPEEVAKRRAANKAARKARAINRKRASR